MTGTLKIARNGLFALLLMAVLAVVFAPAAQASPNDASGFITGAVWQDSNGNGIQEMNELPLANHPVYLQRTGEDVVGAMAAVVYSDADGLFSFENLEVGQYQVYPDGGSYVLVDVQGVNATATIDLPVPVARHFIFMPLTLG